MIRVNKLFSNLSPQFFTKQFLKVNDFNYHSTTRNQKFSIVFSHSMSQNAVGSTCWQESWVQWIGWAEESWQISIITWLTFHSNQLAQNSPYL